MWLQHNSMSARLSVVLVAGFFGLLGCSATGHGQLLDEMLSSGIDIERGPLLTRRIRQSSAGTSPPISTTIIEQQNNVNSNRPPLTCHRCRTFDDGHQCTHLPANSSIFQKTCGPQHTSCMVIFIRQNFSFSITLNIAFQVKMSRKLKQITIYLTNRWRDSRTRKMPLQQWNCGPSNETVRSNASPDVWSSATEQK